MNIGIFLKNMFLVWLCVIGILLTLTGLLHFVNNKPESFKVDGLQTNPTLAVVLVAIVLLVCGLVTVLISGFGIVRSVPFIPLILENGVVCSIWFIIMSCLTFFMTGVFGLVTSILSFITSSAFIVIVVLCKFRNVNSHSQHTEAN
ncbi:hypothetical protein ENUP19_0042G0013 [Entamoeba nuttalli]|uniref:Membrane-spanning protein n=1 Tax=Entamoeba nuttalli TaxID=412467 RepID=A0ABQ0DAA0_9EUKA